MLGLQAATLQQQEWLYQNQVRQSMNEILSRELNFYYQAFGTIATSASVLAGFAFSGLAMSQDVGLLLFCVSAETANPRS